MKELLELQYFDADTVLRVEAMRRAQDKINEFETSGEFILYVKDLFLYLKNGKLEEK